jgi:peroxiredoxin
MRRLLLAVFFFGVFSVFAAGPPRPAGELKFHLSDGTPIQLSSYKGKVCVVEFLFTTCPHCQETARTMSKLYTEFGAKGFQPLGIAFNDNAIMLLPDFIRRYGVNYPTGVAPRDAVLGFLGLSSTTRLMVPQVAIVDRKGMIRFQSSPDGNESLHGESSLREKIQTLLAEGGSKATSAVKKAPVSVAARNAK